jgi:hypothetical protein
MDVGCLQEEASETIGIAITLIVGDPLHAQSVLN